jgi:long-chain acyl-CoA synthetase
LPDLRVVLSAGAPLAPADAAAFHAATGRKVHVFYGSSECGGITYDRTDAPVHEEGAVGTAMARVVVDVVDDGDRPLPAGAQGRVRVHSRAAALAILPAPDDERTLVPGRFLTGDLGRLDDAGRLTLTGRVAAELNVAGKKVHPDEVRRVLLELPGVRSAVVLGIPDPHRGEIVAALVEAEPGSGVDVRSVLETCRARLAPHKVPRRVVVVDRLPLSERGKLQRDEALRLLRGA